jgi:hypothetical protein
MSLAGMPQENPELAARVVGGNKYLQRRQAMQDLVHFQYYDNQTLAIMWTGIILLELIPYYYDTERMQRIIGDDGVPKMVKINEQKDGQGGIYNVKNNLEVGRYDVVMDTGPGYQTKMEENAEAMMELMNTKLAEPIIQAGADVVLRNMDFPGADDLANRLMPKTPEGLEKAMESMSPQAKAIIVSMQQQIGQLQQQNQQQALELKYKGSVEGMRLDQKEKESKREDATKRLDIETKAHTSLSVAEIHGATQLLNTNTEAAHDRAAARELVDNATHAEKNIQK